MSIGKGKAGSGTPGGAKGREGAVAGQHGASGATRARSVAEELAADGTDPREERVRLCIAVGPDRWVRGKTAQDLAAKHGGSLSAWQSAASEAWRRMNSQSATWVRERLSERLERAMRDADDIDDLKDQVRAVVEIAKAWGPLVGANAAQRHELTGANGAPLNLPPEIAVAWPLRETDPAAGELVVWWMATGETTTVAQFAAGVDGLCRMVARGAPVAPEALRSLRSLLAECEAATGAAGMLVEAVVDDDPDGEATQ